MGDTAICALRAGRAALTVLLTAVFVVGCGGNAIAKASFSSSSSGSPIVSAMNGYAASQLPRNQFDQQLAAMQANGVRVVRADAPWANIEPLPPGPAGPTYQFAQTDALVSALATHHLTWEPLIDFSVWWAKTCPGMCAPSSDATYATFAQTIAARYGVHGSFWAQNPQLPYYPAQIFEIWNEENAALFWITPARYASLYSAARAAIHAVDPGASVIVGGLADDSKAYTVAQDYPSWYVTQMFVADPGLRGNVDGFGLHPYGTTAVDVEKWVAHFRQTLTVLGEGAAPIDITEIGWTTGDAARENWRAWMMFNVAFTLSHSNCGIRLLAPYDWIDPLILHESGDFGLVDQSGVDTSLRPAGTGWFHGLAVAPSKPQTPLCGSAQVPAKSLSDVHVRSVRGVSRSRPRRHHR